MITLTAIIILIERTKMIDIDSTKVFKDGFRNDFTLEEFKDWVSKKIMK